MPDIPLIDIRPDHWEMVRAILRQHVPDREVWAFGSRAKWTAKEYSDLDLCIVGETALSFGALGLLKEAFEDSDLPYKVDVVDWAATSESFREIIERDKVVVQEGKRGLGRAGEWMATPYGRFSADFSIDRLSNLCDPNEGIQTGPFGSQLHQEDYVQTGTPIITVEHLGENRILHANTPKVSEVDRRRLSRYRLNKGDIVFSRVGSVDRRALVRDGEDGWLFSGRCLRVRPDPAQIDSQYLSYFFGLSAFKAHIRAIAVGATMPSLNTSLLSEITVPFPPNIEEQRAIAHILGTLDDKIELNRKQNETLEAMARALFKAWFVDFEPVRAKLEGRWQRGQSLPGLPAHLYDLFPDRLVESELGEIPEGWESVPVSRLIEFNPSEPLRKETEAPYIEMAALPTSGSWPESPVLRPFGSGMRFRNGDTLLARITPCLENGKTAFVQCLPYNTVGWGSTEYIVMRPKIPVPKEFGYLLARDAAFREQAIRSMTGTSGRQRVQADSVAAFKLAAPSTEDVWNAFSRVVAPAFVSIKASAEAIIALAQLRDTLLPKLISGELRLSDAERFLGEAEKA